MLIQIQTKIPNVHKRKKVSRKGSTTTTAYRVSHVLSPSITPTSPKYCERQPLVGRYWQTTANRQLAFTSIRSRVIKCTIFKVATCNTHDETGKNVFVNFQDLLPDTFSSKLIWLMTICLFQLPSSVLNS